MIELTADNATADYPSSALADRKQARMDISKNGFTLKQRNAVLVQRMFVPADQVIALGIDKRYCILPPETLKNSFSEVTMLTNP